MKQKFNRKNADIKMKELTIDRQKSKKHKG